MALLLTADFTTAREFSAILRMRDVKRFLREEVNGKARSDLSQMNKKTQQDFGNGAKQCGRKGVENYLSFCKKESVRWLAPISSHSDAQVSKFIKEGECK